MAKSKKRSLVPPTVPTAPKKVWTMRAKQFMGAGLFLVISGFIVLSYADPSGQNWAGTLSPFLLIAGYSLIGISLAQRRQPLSSPTATK